MSEELDLSTEEEVATPQEEHAEPTMDETIAATLQEIESRGETEEQRAERLRDEKGRFAKQEAAPAPEVEPPAEPAPVAAPEPVAVPPELQRLGLRKEEAEAFAKADKVVQDAFLRRSDEMHKGLEQIRGKAQFGEQIAQAIQPYAQTLQTMGVHPAQAVQKLMAADHALRYGQPQQKAQYFAQLAHEYGIDLGQVAEMPPVDPQVHALQSQLQQMQSWIQQQSQAREWQEREMLNSEIARFAQDPAHVHFEAVRNEMSGLLQAGLAKDLNDAYEKAIYANPTIRSQILAQQQAEAEEKRKADAQRKAQEAKQAAQVNVPRKGRLSPSKPVGSMDDTIRQEAERLGIL